MDREATLGRAVQLGAAVDALAALAAYIRVETEGLPADPEIHDLLGRIAHEVTGADARRARAGLRGRAGTVVGVARTRAAPRVRSWSTTRDAAARGTRSTLRCCRRWAGCRWASATPSTAAEGQLDGLAESLATPGARLLDVGTGTGWLSIALARSHPGLHVVGMDLFEPALRLAARERRRRGAG